jgi:hypothetical protein
MYKTKFIFVLIAVLILCGCRSDEYYKDKAADSAREFLFDEFESMTPENKAYIKYTYPEILVAPILGNYSQFCFAWNLPSPKITLLVYGTSKDNFRAWFPVRILVKEYTEQEEKTEADVVLEKPGRLEEPSMRVPVRTNMQ